MFLMYVDESGDTGLKPGSSDYFVLSGLAVHETAWLPLLDDVVAFRRSLRQRFGLKQSTELHAAHFMRQPGELASIPKYQRLGILREVIDFEAQRTDIQVFSVAIDKRHKQGKFDVFDWAWRLLIQRFHNSLAKRSMPGARADDRGMIICDRTDEPKLRKLMRKSRRYNPVASMTGVGSRQIPMSLLVEDAVHRDSQHSLLIQLADVNAYFLYQKLQPSSYVSKKGGTNYLDRMKPVLNTKASRTDPLGIVRM